MAFERLKKLKCFPEVDKRIRGGMTPEEVASFIQNECREYRDIKQDSLARQLYRYKRSIPANQLAIPESKYIHERLKEFAGDVDELQMLQKLWFIQMERIFQFREIEKKTNFPMKGMTREIEQAKDILVRIGEFKIKLGHYEGAATDRLHVQGDVVSRQIEAIPVEARERLGSVANKILKGLLEAGTVEEAEFEVISPRLEETT